MDVDVRDEGLDSQAASAGQPRNRLIGRYPYPRRHCGIEVDDLGIERGLDALASQMKSSHRRAARLPAVKSLDTFDFIALPALNKVLVVEPARSEYVIRHENVIALGPSGTGKTHVALGLGLAACQKGFSVLFTKTASLVNRLMEARDGRQLSRL